MLDLLFEGGTVVDGTGAEPFTADVGVRDGRIVEVGRITEAAKETVQAEGLLVTPGFVDIHTHYDGQVTWDENFTPSIYHGVTTVMMGNCGVGFAPVRPGHEDDLVKLMEGVEDIPGAALHEGIRWGWESFPQYMDALAATPHSLDFLVQVPHDPLRMYVMGERAVTKQAASPDDITAMRDLLHAALKAGAAGFSTGRSDNHRTSEGKDTPAAEASSAELTGIAQAFKGIRHGVVQVVSDFDLLQGPERFDAEFEIVEQLARASGKPLSISWLQRDPGGQQYEAIRARVEAAVEAGLQLYLQTAARGIGVINGLDASFHPFMGFPGYKEVAQLPLAERAAALREPARKARILAEKSDRLAGDGTAIPPLVDILLAKIDLISGRMFPLDDKLNYEPNVMQSFLVQAKQRGITPLEALYDHLTTGDGSNLIYFPIFNYNAGSLDAVRQMLAHPRALSSLSDAGAHVGTVCDASFTTFMLTHWVRDRAQDKLPLAQAVEMMTSRNARYLGLTDRGVIAPGMRADLNLIDLTGLSVGTPRLVRDLPAGGKRFLQKAQGYLGTWVKGVAVQREGNITAERPGQLVRMGQDAH
ncbi:MAG: amidohydrolase family protein [Gammaproteobacteria bacterium]|nr:amidohydrolase family protein [Gammaproteobacteria bacterium]MBU0786705.1 amidohydrolase family protein [Gammaproteobacteria bacterium]MBU0814089.1 amidohydrolase family protein [Gammaproteobacteria bacterium]MBU1788438.1 amidohydrolase family protein [Gammaproteobacteria bacterium]